MNERALGTLEFDKIREMLVHHAGSELGRRRCGELVPVDTKEEAENLLIDINNGIAFEDLAKEYSKCPSGRDGGDLRWFGKGMMVKPFEDAAFSLEVGELSGPVQTQFGWHLIKVTDKNSGKHVRYS